MELMVAMRFFWVVAKDFSVARKLLRCFVLLLKCFEWLLRVLLCSVFLRD